MRIHKCIYTGQKQIPWTQAFLLAVVWFAHVFHIFAGGQALTFMVQRYTEDPRIISLVMTLNVIIMLGPFISYISDQVWTRMGRRRPFIILAWAAASFAMFSFAFMPQVAGTINDLLATVGIPPVAEFALFIAIIVGYTTFYDLTAPVEPLFLECVPPRQRGRFWAVRNVLASLAVTIFYQVLWPLYDDQVDLLKWLGAPGVLSMRGDRMIFFLAGALFFITGLFMILSIRETKVPDAPNKRFRDLGLGKFVVDYFKDVFLTRSNYAYYIVLVIPTMESMVWGNFGALMLNDQFGYSKDNQALYAFPMQLMSMALLTPFAGWYSDAGKRFPRWLRVGILVAAGFSFVMAVRIYGLWAPVEIRELPPFWVISIITFLVAAGTAGVLIAVVEELLDWVGREHTRVWVSLLIIVVHFSTIIAQYVCIQSSNDKIIPITLLMCFFVGNTTLGALLGTFVGPMIFEYIPRNNLGTINSGRGVYSDSLRFMIANLGAWWVWWYSAHIYHPPHSTYDYSSMYLLQFVLMIPALLAKVYFLRQVVTGRIKKWGVIEVEGEIESPSVGPAPTVS